MTRERARIPTVSNSSHQGFTYILYHASGGISPHGLVLLNPALAIP
jgi:hypothetical protein